MNKLKNYGISTIIINTPSSISKSCSLSLKTSNEYFAIIKKIINQSNYSDLIGIFLAETSRFGERINRLY